MQSDGWEKCTDIFNAALERAPGERSAFLEQECAGNEELRRRVDFLLKFDSQSEGFLETPAFETAPGLLLGNNDALLGQQLGFYRIDSILGVGGMGV